MPPSPTADHDIVGKVAGYFPSYPQENSKFAHSTQHNDVMPDFPPCC